MAPRLKLFAIDLLTISLTACNVKRVWYRLLPPDMAWYQQDTPDSKDNHPLVRRHAAALGEIKDPRTVEPLVAALKDKNSDVRKRAARALTKITGKGFFLDMFK